MSTRLGLNNKAVAEITEDNVMMCNPTKPRSNSETLVMFTQKKNVVVVAERNAPETSAQPKKHNVTIVSVKVTTV